jgi:3-oxoacyl-[acyl-carrier protein] reductase
MRLENQVVLITGASRGLGKEIALQLRHEGCHIILASRNRDDLEKVRKQIGERAFAIAADVTSEKDIVELYKRTIEKFGRVDILINNAGFNDRKLLTEYTLDDWQKILDTNARSVFLCTREFAKQGGTAGGTIVIISSMAGLFGAREYSIYCASKHALEGFAKSIRFELKGTRVIVLHPYRLRTCFHKAYRKPSPDSEMIEPRYYAEYVAARIKGDILRAALCQARNYILWAVGIFRSAIDKD